MAYTKTLIRDVREHGFTDYDSEKLQGVVTTVNTNFTNIEQAMTDIAVEGTADAVGAMVTGNTETGIAVSYQDSDNTLDFEVAYGAEAPGDVDSSTSGAVGELDAAARADHSHNLGEHGHTGETDGGDLSTTYAAASHSHAAADLSDATATPTGDKIPIADNGGTLDSWVSLSTKADASHAHDVDDVDFTEVTLGALGIVVPADGSGCTVDITADAGVITDIVLNAGGLNYQASDVVTIAGGNADATATVATVNAETGAVTAIGLTAAGTGYTTGTGVATTTTTTRAWSTTAMSGLTNASTLQAALQAIHDDIVTAT
jgi:hypothetical protein